MRFRLQRERLTSAVGIIVAVTALVVLLMQLAPGWNDATEAVRSAGMATLAVVAVSILTAETAFALIWTRNTRAFGSPLRYGEGGIAYFYSGLSRFLPGAVLPYVARVGLVSRGNVSAVHASVAMGMETVLSAIAALSLAFIGLGGRLVETDAIRRNSILLLVLGVTLVGVVSYRLLPWFLRSIGRSEPSVHIPLRSVLLSIGQYSAAWLTMGIGVSSLVHSLSLSAIGPIDAAGALALAWFAGFVAVPVPGGLGVREAVLAGVLADVAGFEIGILVALIHRVAWSLVIALVGTLAVVVRHSGATPQADTSRGGAHEL